MTDTRPTADTRSAHLFRWSAALVLAFACAACGGPEAAPAPAADPAAEPPAAAGTIAPPSAGESRLVWELPPGWTEEPPSTGFRLAQANVPGAAGDAELAVFFFGPGQGGGAEANIERWLGQIETAAGDPEPERETFASGELEVTTVYATGTLLPSRMGMGPEVAQPGAALLGAVVEGPGGPWFFKATGPAETLAVEREPFLEMLRGLRVES